MVYIRDNVFSWCRLFGFVIYNIFEILEPNVVVHSIMSVCGDVYMWYIIRWFVSEFDGVWVNVLFAAVVCKCFANRSVFSLLVSTGGWNCMLWSTVYSFQLRPDGCTRFVYIDFVAEVLPVECSSCSVCVFCFFPIKLYGGFVIRCFMTYMPKSSWIFRQQLK